MSIEERLADPPPAPPMQRKVRLKTAQWILVPLLLFLPAILASAGVFGSVMQSERVHSGSLDATVEWPARMRYKQLDQITIRLRNLSPVPWDSVTLELDPGYGVMFSTVRALPAFNHPYSLTLRDVRAEGLGVVELQAERYGRHQGLLTIRTPSDTASLIIRTIVFP